MTQLEFYSIWGMEVALLVAVFSLLYALARVRMAVETLHLDNVAARAERDIQRLAEIVRMTGLDPEGLREYGLSPDRLRELANEIMDRYEEKGN